MTEDSDREEKILHDALRIPAGSERDAYLDEACGGDEEMRREIEELLVAAAKPASAIRNVGDLADDWFKGVGEDEEDTVAIAEGPGSVIGAYKLLEKIGEGAFGVVFMAEQRGELPRRVALKIIKEGMDTREVIARFEAERRALALMEHSHIAKVFDAGATETGRPYFVMELVRGVPITQFCDDKKHTIRQRLALFMAVCDAVTHAHQKGIIHRDLKPSNILVGLDGDRPVPKVIDFGIAKATQQRLTEKTYFTSFKQFIGTFPYLCPEQSDLSALDIDTRADIYALGVVLYELLAGRLPFDPKTLGQAGFEAMRRVVRDQEPPKPSTQVATLHGEERRTVETSHGAEMDKLQSLIRGDLDWIVMKAMEKDRDRRYETANALRQDVERFLNDEPVEAGPPSSSYRIRKFVRRNRAAVLAAATILTLLMAGVLGTSWFAIEATRSKGEALASEQKARAALAKSRFEEAKAWLERARLKQSQKDHFGAAMMAAKGLGFGGFGAEHQSEEFRALHPQLLDKEKPEFKKLTLLALRSGKTARPIWQSSISAHHKGVILSVAFSPDGRKLASGSWDGTIKLWDVSTGQEPQTLEGHEREVTSVAFSSDGRSLASGGSDKTIKLWDVSTGQEIQTLEGHEIWVHSVAFSPDGRTLASGSGDGTIKLWDVSTGQEPQTLEGHTNGVTSVAFSPDGRSLASGSWDVTIKLWDVSTGKETQTLEGHKHGVYSVAFSPDGRSLASGSQDGSIKLWDVSTGKEIQTLEGHEDRVDSVAFSPDGRTLVSGSEDGSIKLWDVSTGKGTQTLEGHTNGVTSVAFSPDGRSLVSGSWDGTIKLWDVSTGQEPQTLEGHTNGVTSVAFSPDGRTLASGSGDGTIKLWDVSTGQEIQTLEGHTTSVAFSPDGRTLASGNYDRTIKLWDVSTGQETRTLEGHKWEVSSVAFSPDGRSLASGGSRDGTIKLWDVSTGQETQTMEGHENSVTSVAFSPDGRSLVSGSGGTIKLWDVSTGQETQILEGHKRHVTSVAFSPDGRSLVSGSLDRSIKLWNVSTGQEIQTLEGHESWVTSSALELREGLANAGTPTREVSVRKKNF